MGYKQQNKKCVDSQGVVFSMHFCNEVRSPKNVDALE